MSLTTEAAAALLAAEAAAEAAREAERRAMRAAATEAVKAALVRPDGTTLTLAQAALAAVDVKLREGLVVYSDGASQIAAQRVDGVWSVIVVRQVDGQWTKVAGPVTDLATIGAALRTG